MLDKINEKNRENIDRIVVVQSDIEAIDKSRKKKKREKFRTSWMERLSARFFAYRFG